MLNLPQIRNSALVTVDATAARVDADDRNPRGQNAERTVTHRQARILSIGDDSILLYSRRLILETAGYAVESARAEQAAIERILLRRFDLVLLCHSITEEVVKYIVEASMRIAPQTPLLQISPLDNPFRTQAHPALVSADPAALLSAIAGQLANRGERYRLRATG